MCLQATIWKAGVAVVSEAMNSGCCVVANRQIGAVPFLIEDGVNGKKLPGRLL